MSHELYELDVRLRGIEPPIWRTVEVPGEWSLERVHFAIQVAMGWTNSHLHQFTIGGTHYGMILADEPANPPMEDERKYRLDVLVASGDSFVYEYDFGDDWAHDVMVKKVTTVSKSPRARCTAGARACPPEDCGGPHGYAHLLEVLASPRHKEHQDLKRWANGFKPELFSLPKNGLDLHDEMDELKALADEGEQAHGPRGDGPLVGIPERLLEEVLALEPMQRAAIVSLLAGSLATELERVSQVAVGLLADAKKGDKKKSTLKHRKPARP